MGQDTKSLPGITRTDAVSERMEMQYFIGASQVDTTAGSIVRNFTVQGEDRATAEAIALARLKYGCV